MRDRQFAESVYAQVVGSSAVRRCSARLRGREGREWLPFCVVGAWLAARNLPKDEPAPRPRLDVVGMLLLSPGIAAAIYGLTQLTGSDGLTSPKVWLPLTVGLALLLGYLGWALRRGPDVLVNIRLFRHPALASSSVLVFLSGAALYGTMLLLPLFWQQVRGEPALGAALLLIPQGVGTLISRTLAGRYKDSPAGVQAVREAERL